MAPEPEQVRGWLGVLMPLLERAGAVLTLFTLVIGALVVYWLLGSLTEQRSYTRQLHDKLLTCLEAKVALAQQCHERP